MRSVGNPTFSLLSKVHPILIVVHKVEVSSLDLIISHSRPVIAPSKLALPRVIRFNDRVFKRGIRSSSRGCKVIVFGDINC
jgi:hypothetical protein